MGDRSSMDYIDLEIEDVDKFISNLMAEKVGCKPDDRYYFDSIKLSSKETCHYENNNSEVWIDWDDWKIQGYWYEPFCNFLTILHKCGMRGEICLTFCDGSPYYIYFGDKGVTAEIKGDYETYEITEKGLA